MEMRREHSLAAHLRACGHFLYYQTGGKAGQRRILVMLLRHEGLSQKELQDMLEISSGALSEILQKMEDAALVVREKSRGDKRRVSLSLTPRGREAAERTHEHYIRTLGRMFECLSKEEMESLDATLAKLTAHLDTLKADPALELDG